MRLNDLFDRANETGWTQTRLARSIGRSQSHLSKLAKHGEGASVWMALDIERATGGLVKAEEVPMSDRVRSELEKFRKATRVNPQAKAVRKRARKAS